MPLGSGGVRFPSKRCVTHVTGVTILHNSLYLLDILRVTPSLWVLGEGCYYAYRCNASEGLIWNLK